MGEDTLLHFGLIESGDDGSARHVRDERGVIAKHCGVLPALVVKCLHGAGEGLTFGVVERDVGLCDPLLRVDGEYNAVCIISGFCQVVFEGALIYILIGRAR